MKRKVIQIAGSTQLISLPRKWAIANYIKKGDELDITEQGNKLVITTENISASNSVTIDITGLDRTSIIFLIRGLYKKGIDEINLNFGKPTCTHYRLKQQTKVISAIHSEINRLAGMEIFQQKENMCILKAISSPSDKELDNMIRRVFLLLLDATKDMIEGAKNADSLLLETIEEKHDTITRFISYSLRIMNKIRNEDSDTYFLYHILASLDKVTDLLKICARDLLNYKHKMKKESCVILDMVYDSFRTYYSVFYQFDFDILRKLNENKELVSEKLTKSVGKIPPEELMTLCNMQQSLELFRDLSEARMAMNF